MSFASLVDQLAPDPQTRGRQFELLCRWYLQNAPEYRTRLERVWLWKEWPGIWGPDTGIDLVAETVDGDPPPLARRQFARICHGFDRRAR